MRLKWYKLLHLKWVWNLLVTVLLLSLLERGVVWYVLGGYSISIFYNHFFLSNFIRVSYFELILCLAQIFLSTFFFFHFLIKNSTQTLRFFFLIFFITKMPIYSFSMKIKRAKRCIYFLYSNSLFWILKLKT